MCICLAVRAMLTVNLLLAVFSRVWMDIGVLVRETFTGWEKWAGRNSSSAFAGLAESCDWNRTVSWNSTVLAAAQMENGSASKKDLGSCKCWVTGMPFQGRGTAPCWALQVEESDSYFWWALAGLHLSFQLPSNNKIITYESSSMISRLKQVVHKEKLIELGFYCSPQLPVRRIWRRQS